MKSTLKNISLPFYLVLFISLHLVLWSLVPAFIRYNLPLDSIEGTVWGHQLEWGYDKNPFLNAWLTAFATYLDGQSGWMVYFFSQISVVACFWAVWRLGRMILPPLYALISVLLLESVQYYNFHAIDFNDNTLELGLWALTIFCFYQALSAKTKKSSLLSWVGVGLFAALGMMAKYYTAALLTAMALFLFVIPQNRRHLTSPFPYIGLSIFLAIIMPHIIWLFYHDFITVQYVFLRASSPPSWTNHLFFPLQFAWQQLQTFLPALILFALLFVGKKPRIAQEKTIVSAFDKQFLLYMGLGPFLLTILLSLFLGIKLRAGWGMPLLSLWGLILFAYLQPTFSKQKVYTFIAVIFLLMGAMLAGYSFSLLHSSDASSANFPGKELAQTITREWHEKYHTKLSYVAGSRWIGGNIEFYSSDHPAVYMEWDREHAPWIDIQALQQKGAVFVWDINENESLPQNIKQQFPTLKDIAVMSFSWRRNKHIAPVQIGIAWLPPAL